MGRSCASPPVVVLVCAMPPVLMCGIPMLPAFCVAPHATRAGRSRIVARVIGAGRLNLGSLAGGLDLIRNSRRSGSYAAAEHRVEGKREACSQKEHCNEYRWELPCAHDVGQVIAATVPATTHASVRLGGLPRLILKRAYLPIVPGFVTKIFTTAPGRSL